MKQVVVLLFTAIGIAAAQNGLAADGDVASGTILFTKIGCYQCHGYAGQGGRAGARLAATSLKAQDLIRYVRRPPLAMPAYTEKIASDQELTDIWAYIKSMPPPKPVRDITLLNQIKERQ
jgi:mono/diheme cytochrome c family protein